MTKGLVRDNNLSDLPDPEAARINLGLRTEDYQRIKGLFLSSGLTNLDVQKINNSSSNFQSQINSSTARLATIEPSLYADKSGDTLTGTWTNQGKIGASGIIENDILLSGSTDSTFSRSLPLSSLEINASGITMPSGLKVAEVTSSGNVTIESGLTVANYMSILVDGREFRIEVV